MDAEHTEKPEQSHPEPAPPARGHVGAYWLLSAFVFLLFYLLSIGPVAKVCWRLDMPVNYARTVKAVDTVYAPIYFLAEKYPQADSLLEWYVTDVWRVPRACDLPPENPPPNP